jgi:vacuolar-type H+-ATPase subunit I/STV1
MRKAPLNAFAITAADFDLDSFNEAVNDVRNTRKQVVDFGSDFEDTRVRLEEAQAGLKAAMAVLDLDEITKITTECKRLKAKLETTPVTKIQAFDEAMDKLSIFFESGCRAVNLEELPAEKKAA